MILLLGTNSSGRYIESGMAANGKIHGFVIKADYFPAYTDLVLLQNMLDLQLKIIWIIFSCGIRRFQLMGDGISSHIHAGKFAVSGKSMLTGRIFDPVDAIMVLKMTSHIRKKNRCMAFPVSRICLPDHFSVMYFIKNAAKLSTMIVYRYSQIVVFNCMNHK